MATLTYDRVALVAYLAAADDRAPRLPGDLCARHVARLVLPRQWHLDDRRAAVSEPVAEKPARTKRARPKKLRVVPSPKSASPAGRTRSPRSESRPKWADVTEPSLFDSSAPDAVRPAPLSEADTVAEPEWMPRFGPDSELDEVLDAKTPLLRRAFGAG